MKRWKNSVLLLILFAGLLVYVWFRERGEVVRGPIALRLDPESIVSVTIERKQAPQQIRLTKKGKSWWMEKPVRTPADPSAVKTLTERFKALKIEEELDSSAKEKPEFGLKSPAATVTVTDDRNRTYTIVLGNKTPDGMKVYALVNGQDRPIAISSWLLDDSQKSPTEYRDKKLLNFKKERVQRLAVRAQGQTIVMEMGDGKEWKIVQPIQSPAEKGSIDSILDRLSGLQAREFVTEQPKPEDLARFQLNQPPVEWQVWIKGRDKPLTLWVGKQDPKTKTRFFAKSHRFPAVVLIDEWEAKELKKDLAYFRSKKILALEKEKVEHVTLTAAGQQVVLSKVKEGDEERWRMEKPKPLPADTWKVDDLLWTLEGMEAREFIDRPANLAQYGLDKPQVELVVQEKGRKEPKKVWLSIKGKEGFAKTNLGPTVYKIFPTTVKDLTKSPNDFRDLQVVKFSRDEVTEILLAWDKKKVHLVKRGEKDWERREPKKGWANWDAVDAVLFELESLRADKWIAEKPGPQHGLDQPSLQATIKRTKGPDIVVRFGKESEANSVFVSSSYSADQVYRKAKFVLDNLKRRAEELVR
ncbi:MAG: DUF4340 domain-containing protein [Armatimonadetes bacterium]|nr:DUF4340 domain-containing protein [Armatimonadota bacterium]MDW8121876.1 DUF4340 domain-containing protein [Armatimonadota bacterium]